MDNYKGIYYKETKEQKYYEGGAHFQYKVLYNILLDLGGVIYQDDNSNNYFQDYLSIKKQKEKNMIKYKTRNLEQNNYINMNNPNTLVKYSSQNIFFNNEKNKKNYISRNNNILYNDNNSELNKRSYATSININQAKKNNIDNHLLKILLNKKEKEKNYEEKNNDESSNENKYSFMNFYKNVHYRNRSEFSTNIEINRNNKINKVDKNAENSKNDFRTYIRNKINIIKNYNSKSSLEFNRKNKESNNEKEKVNKNNQFISVQRQNSNSKHYLSYYQNVSKKSRNNNNILDHKTTYENNKNDSSNNCPKKAINKNLLKTTDNENIINNCFLFNINKAKNFSNYTINNSKGLNNKQKQNDLIFQKYKKKKINQLCCFNLNNAKAKSGNNIFAKNINKLNIIHSKVIAK